MIYTEKIPSTKLIIETAITSTIKRGGHVPMLLVNGKNCGSMVGFEHFPSEQEEKVKIMLRAGVTVGEQKELFGDLVSVYFIGEAWASAYKDKPPKDFVSPSLDPKRKEILIVSGKILDPKETIFEAFEFVRDDNAKLIELKPFTHEGKGKTTSSENPLLDAFLFGYKKAIPKPPNATA